MTYFNYYFTFTRCGTSKDVYFKTSVSILLFSEMDFKVSSSVLTCGDNNRKEFHNSAFFNPFSPSLQRSLLSSFDSKSPQGGI